MGTRPWGTSGLGWIIAVLVVIAGFLLLVEVIDTNTDKWIYGLLIALGVAHLV